MPRKTSIPRGIKKKWAWATKKLPPSVLSLTSQQIKSAYGVTEKKCSAGTCRRNCKDNPNCFQHLGGEKWLYPGKTVNIADEIIKERCRKDEEPVGLVNLGATCYVNSLIQILFSDVAFRNAVYSVPITEDEAPPTSSKEAPPTDSKEAPPTDNKEALPTSSKEAPPTSSKEALPTSSKEAPPTNSKEAPPTNSKEAPPTNSKEAPPTNSKEAPPTSSKEAPPTNSKEAPPTSSKEAPPTSSVDISSTKCIDQHSADDGNHPPPSKRPCVAASMETSGSSPVSNERDQPFADSGGSDDFQSSSVVSHLKYVFSRLHLSSHKWVSLQHLVDFLGLGHEEQQDVQEFRKLFLSLLEPQLCLGDGGKCFIAEHYTGTYCYITTCKGCGTSKEISSSYQELELSIEGKETLEESLEDFFKEELLTGDNKYFCTTCGSKQDATRRISLKSTPPILTLLLMRFVFNMSLMVKTKVTSSVIYPETLDLSRYSGCQDDVYKLTSVIIHLGPTAYSGHYIAHIRDTKTEKWWRYDDQCVKPISGRRSHIGQEEEIDTFGEPQIKVGKAPRGYLSSTNAYLLVYSKVKTQLLQEVLKPPCNLVGMVKRENETLMSEVDHLVRESKSAQVIEETKQKEVAEIFTNLSVKPGSKSFHWLSTKLLSKVFSGEEPCVINNDQFVCSHNKLSLDMVEDLKRVDSAMGSYLYKKFCMKGQQLTNDMLCGDCVYQKWQQIQIQQEMLQDQKLLVTLLKAPCTSSSGFWIGKTTFQNWKSLMAKAVPLPASKVVMDLTESSNEGSAIPVKRLENQQMGAEKESLDPNKADDFKCEDERSIMQECQPVASPKEDNLKLQDEMQFNSDITCPHGQLIADENQRKLISACAWSIFKKYFPGVPEYEALSPLCSNCMALLVNEAEEVAKLKERAATEKTALPDLHAMRNRPQLDELKVGEVVYAVPSDFYTQWIQFIKYGTVKYLPDSELSSLVCKHDQLLVDFNLSQESSVLLWPREWDVVKTCYNDVSEVKVWRCENIGDGKQEPLLCSDPGPCGYCVEAERQQETLTYDQGTVYVLKTDEDPLNYGVTESKQTKSGWSFRRRFPAGSNRIRIKALQTLKDLKLQLLEHYDLLPSEMSLYQNGKLLVDDGNLTLVELGITPNSLIILKVPTVEESISEFLKETAANFSSKEGGFTGTNLM